MKVTYKGDNITIHILKNNCEDIKDYVKKVVLKLKNKTNKYLSGFYIANVYLNNIYGIVIELIKEDDFDFFKDFIELDIKVIDNSNMYLKFSDYFIPINKNSITYYDKNYYINVDKLVKKDFYRLIEHSTLVYGEEVKKLENKLQKIEIVV